MKSESGSEFTKMMLIDSGSGRQGGLFMGSMELTRGCALLCILWKKLQV